MTADRESEDEQGGLETSTELRHGETFPTPSAPAPSAPQEKALVGGWRVWVSLLIVLVILGLVIYILVSVL